VKPGLWPERLALLAGLLLNALAAVFYVTPLVTMNTASRLATIDSLVHRGTYRIEDSRYFFTIDKSCFDGRFYSSKPPLLSTVLAGPYWVWNRLTGLSFDKAEPAAVKFISIVGAGIPHLILLLYFYRCLLLWTEDRAGRVLGMLALSFGYLGLAYIGGVNNHTPGAAALCAAFYYTLRIRLGQARGDGDWLLAGATTALVPLLELPGALFSLAFGLALLRQDWRRTLTRFVPAALPVLALHPLLTSLSIGGWLPAYLRGSGHFYPGSYWYAPTGIDNLNESHGVYLFHVLLGHHGLFSMMPVLLLAPLGAWWRGRLLPRGWRDGALVWVPFVLVVVLLVFETNNYGGCCVGFRWLLFVAPLLFLFSVSALARLRGWAWRTVFVLGILVAALHVADALPRPYGPWNHSRWHTWFIAHGWGSVPPEAGR